MSLDSSGQKRDLHLKKVFSVLLFGDKPPVFSWVVLSQLCKKSAFCSAPPQLSLGNVQQWFFQRCRQVPEHYTPPSFDLVSACWMLCLEVVEPSRTGQPQCRCLGGSEKALMNASISCPCGLPCPWSGHSSVVSLLRWEVA